VCICVCVCVCVCARERERERACVLLDIYIHSYTYTFTHTHAHTHMHTQLGGHDNSESATVGTAKEFVRLSRSWCRIEQSPTRNFHCCTRIHQHTSTHTHTFITHTHIPTHIRTHAHTSKKVCEIVLGIFKILFVSISPQIFWEIFSIQKRVGEIEHIFPIFLEIFVYQKTCLGEMPTNGFILSNYARNICSRMISFLRILEFIPEYFVPTPFATLFWRIMHVRMRTCVCVYVRVFICMFVHKYVCANVCVCVIMHACMCVCVGVCMCVCVCSCIVCGRAGGGGGQVLREGWRRNKMPWKPVKLCVYIHMYIYMETGKIM